MRIDIWSDVVCPFCYIGRRRLQAALDEFEHADQVEITWHSFELDPTTRAGANTPVTETLAAKYGITAAQVEQQHAAMAEQAQQLGLTYNGKETLNANTFDAHRLVHHAGVQVNGRGIADRLEQRFMKAYFTDGQAVDDHAVLTDLAVEVGLDEAEVRDVLSGDRYAEDVRRDEQAARQLGISGVPFFVFAEKYAVSGAQPQEVFAQALAKAWEETQQSPFQMVVGNPAGNEGAGNSECGPAGCSID